MSNKLNEELMEVKEKLRLQQKHRKSLSMAQQSLNREKSKLEELEVDLKKEGYDVKKLEGLSLTGLFYSILGSREEQLEKERQEYLTAKLKYDRCKHSVSKLERDIDYLKQQIDKLKDLDAQYKSVLDRKEKLLLKTGDQNVEKLIKLSEELADTQSEMREFQEAIDAGNNVLHCLGNVIKSLKSAGNWGTWDMFGGGGLIATAIKHSKIDKARASAQEAQTLLERFQRELTDVASGSGISIEISSFSTFADYFLDCLITDWIVQSKIKSSLENAKDMENKVNKIVENLRANLKNAEKKVQDKSENRRKLIESM